MKTGWNVAFSILAVACLGPVLIAQAPRNHELTLKNWAAPLYWQPTLAETAAMGLKPEAKQTLVQTDALAFVAMTPCRVVDTRAGQGFPSPFGGPSLVANASRTFPIQLSANCAIPAAAQAYSLNVTVVPPGPLGYLTIWPTGQLQPNAVTLDDIPGDIRNNAAIVPAGTSNGSVNVLGNAGTDVVIDINGYFAPQNTIATANANSAFGFGALFSNTTGSNNAAGGSSALYSNTTGSQNTANGASTLATNTTGSNNTATGQASLYTNTTGNNNTASGMHSLNANTTGGNNTADGYLALLANTIGSNNTAEGAAALYKSVTGKDNTASGDWALQSNLTGNGNTGIGQAALSGNTGGNNNTGLGYKTLTNSSFGSGNIALGAGSGTNIVTTSNNIDIGNTASGSDSGAIRIGNLFHTVVFAAGIRGVSTGKNNAVPVVIDSNGQLGTINSSRRFKQDIQDMANASSSVLQLRPVTYRYTTPYADGSMPLDYGLIAEEVAQVYPDMVVRNADGQIQTVQYHKLTPMLLNELQKNHATIEARTLVLQRQAETEDLLAAQVTALEKAMDAVIAGPVR